MLKRQRAAGSTPAGRNYGRWLAAGILVASAFTCSATAQDQKPQASLTSWSTDAVEPARFVAVHGEQSVVMGYPATGLEIWAYPLQILSGYTVAFEPADSTRTLSGARLLRRVEYRSDEVVRTYVGSDFVVHEHIFVPLYTPGAILSYDVSGRGNILIRVHFTPSLNLMWPGALGGQGLAWSDALSGYTVTEPLYGYSATIASPEQTRHDATVNRTIAEGDGDELVLMPKPAPKGGLHAEVYVGLDTPHTAPGATVARLQRQEAGLRAATKEHAQQVLADAVSITTPDEETNHALAWATLALDQAWVCNPQLGCGEVAGYGPSRPGRRPQYDWFFAGDGLVAAEALLAEGNDSRARDELAFILRYQNAGNGMIWHEMSQSAGLIDWQKHYPYMFVHVDITFQFLAALADYVRVTGDLNFLHEHWTGIARAYAYCRSTLDGATGLPQIPAGKEGGDEQDRMRDDLGLSSEWIAAAAGYATLARAVGDTAEASAADKAAERARHAIAAQDWDAARNYWIAGHTVAGKAIEDERPSPIGILAQDVFTQVQASAVLDRIASAQFQTDWGTRSMSSASEDFDPDSYSKGSVSALATSEIALAYWQQHRPLTAWQIWSGLVPWNTLDSMGHLHEVLAGDVYHPQVESVPEQTWSSAGFLSAAVRGLLGLRVDARSNVLTFAPHLPAAWHEVTVAHLRAAHALVTLHLVQGDGAVLLEATNNGEAITLDFVPELPLGAVMQQAQVDGNATRWTVESTPQEQAARLQVTLAAHATTRCRMEYQGGIAIATDAPHPQIGEPSRGLRIEDARYADRTLTLTADVPADGEHSVRLLTSWLPKNVEGAQLEQAGRGVYTLRFPASAAGATSSTTVHAVVHFAAAH